ncbi:cell division protein ZapD [Limnobacter humi]|uniref:Cell division protein ZapD n=1 Tax=Limnobacter humi TaxID=1778671 RepID=A0ABT1WI18_9BURK|nr:cell division protein ZapD [Limnobacter humi]
MTQVLDGPHTTAPVSQLTRYEFPLNERIRTLLRLEDLFSKFNFFVSQDHRLDHHTALLTLFEIIEVGSRADLKSDLLQELDRQRTTLSQFRNHPNVDRDALEETLGGIDWAVGELNQFNGRLGYHLRDNEFLMIIRSRCSIPGGVCEFDLPGYHRWQSRPASARRTDIQAWFDPMRPLAKAVELVLKILRDSGEMTLAVAEQGSFTQQMSGKTYQLLTIDLPSELEVVPEFSANKYMLWVRFNVPNANGVSKNNPYLDPVEFRIRLCSL